MRYLFAQDNNPDSIVLWPGGMYGEQWLVTGEISTLGETRKSLEIYGIFRSAITRGFRHIKNYQVGPEAERMLDGGVRLVTVGVDEPAEYDLKRD